jgi:hypothetical protein
MATSTASDPLVVFYSPRTQLRGGEPLQRFTAVARVVDEEPYQVEMTPTFRPWPRRVVFLPCQEVPIPDMVAALDFIEDTRRWGFPFRRGLFEIGADDFGRIACAMKAQIEDG